jgi:hypothetical protein
MNDKQIKHKDLIKAQFSERVERKYVRGALEHGGNLWDKPGMLDNALNEVTDLVTYIFTLAQQLKQIKTYLYMEDYKAAEKMIDKILANSKD